jgi:hypothetical protein
VKVLQDKVAALSADNARLAQELATRPAESNDKATAEMTRSFRAK